MQISFSSVEMASVEENWHTSGDSDIATCMHIPMRICRMKFFKSRSLTFEMFWREFECREVLGVWFVLRISANLVPAGSTSCLWNWVIAGHAAHFSAACAICNLAFGDCAICNLQNTHTTISFLCCKRGNAVNFLAESWFPTYKGASPNYFFQNNDIKLEPPPPHNITPLY